MMTFGGAAITSQKMNSKSCKEAELIWVDKTLSQILGSIVYKIILYQENKTIMIMETNSKSANSKLTKHIKVCYFIIKDEIDQKEVVIENCSSEEM